jgi:hypothetical protein
VEVAAVYWQEHAVKDKTEAGDGRQAAPHTGWFTTDVDQEIAIDVRGMEPEAVVATINGTPITSQAPVDIGSAWVQLREDGRLTVSPNSGHTGRVSFECTVLNPEGRPSVLRTVVDVVGDPAGAAHAESSAEAAELITAEVLAGDVRNAPDAPVQSGLDADMFTIVGEALYLREGIEFEFGSPQTLSIDLLGDAAASASGPKAYSDFSSDASGDAFVFAPGFTDASDAAANGLQEVIDLSLSPFATFQQLLDSGALVQDGPNVVLTVDPSDPLHSDKITLRGVDIDTLSDSDFKF